MRRYLSPSSVVLVLSLLVFGSSGDLGAQAAAEVEAAVRAHYAAINAGDMETAAGHHAAEYTLFFIDQGERSQYTTREAQLAAFSGMSEEGFETDWTIDDLEVDVHGDGAVGVATFYITGTVVLPGQPAPEQGEWRVTEIWVETDEGWREVHAHMSPMVAGTSGS